MPESKRMPSDATNVNHYETLGLAGPGTGTPPATVEQVKAAYRRALLRFHPDKLSVAERSEVSSAFSGSGHAQVPRVVTIDEIRRAHEVLSTPSLRREYDRQLLTASSARRSGAGTASQQTTELELVDLDDMHFDEKDGVYYRACRCGNARGFAVLEDDLADADAAPAECAVGEVLLECPDCSHHLRVTFSFLDDE